MAEENQVLFQHHVFIHRLIQVLKHLINSIIQFQIFDNRKKQLTIKFFVGLCFENSHSLKKPSLDPDDIIIEPQLNNKNVNHYLPSIPEISLDQSEQIIKTKYTELLVHFFQTHQPSYIFEPLRKEYYWTDEPFDEEKITRLEKYV